MDDLRERIARALADHEWEGIGCSPAQWESDREYWLTAANAVLDIIRPLLKDGGAFEVID